MPRYYARMLDANTSGEGSYVFEGPPDLMRKTAHEIIAAFFEYIQRDILKTHAHWELNGVMKNKERDVVTVIGSLIPHRNYPPLPFLLMISDRAA
jgi:hypothetical protein